MKIKEWRKQAINILTPISATASLDCDLLLTFVTGYSRAKLFCHDDELLSDQQRNQLTQLINRRQQGEPIAYIIGEKAFWSLQLTVNQDTLIPRPETELLVECALNYLPPVISKPIADIGTGSGAIALALASERNDAIIHATDINSKTLIIAEQNREKYQLNNITFFQGDFCEALPNSSYQMIISNPPYIDKTDEQVCQSSRRFEPTEALFSSQSGLFAIHTIIRQARSLLAPAGYLILEHGHSQREQVTTLLCNNGYQIIQRYNDLAQQPRAIVATIV